MPLVVDQEQLRNWLIEEIRPICDADPNALAKYVVALVRKDKPEAQLKAFCVEQLEVFLQAKSASFVDHLFDVINRDAYKTKPPAPAAAPAAAPAPVAAPPAASSSHAAAAPPRAPQKQTEAEPVSKKQPSPVSEKQLSPIRQAPPAVAVESHSSASTSAEPAKSSSSSQPSRESNGSSRDSRPQRKRVSPPRSSSRSPRRSRSPRERRRVTAPSGPSSQSNRSLAPSSNSSRYRRGRSRSRSRSPYERHERSKRDERETQPPRRRRCRDFDEMGYCTRGDSCNFDHGPDPVVMDTNALEKIGLTQTRPAVVAQRPPLIDYSVPPPGYNPVNPPPPGVETTLYGAPTVASQIEGYNPEAPALTDGISKAINFSQPPPMAGAPWNPTTAPPQVYANVSVVPSVPKATISDATQQGGVDSKPAQPGQGFPQHGGGFRGGFRGRGRGNRYNQYLTGGFKNGAAADNCSLQVRKIPPEFNNIAKLNEHFEQFGTIVNMQVKYQGDVEAALITYSNKTEAGNAYKSTTPIFNNRFIRVFWHNEGGQAVSQVQGESGETPANAAASQFPFSTRGRGFGRGGFHSARGAAAAAAAAASSAPGTAASPTNAVPTEGQSDTLPKKPVINPELAAAREKFRKEKEIRDKEKFQKDKLMELFTKKNEVLTKQMDCQTQLFTKFKAEQNAENRKKLMELFNKCDEAVKTLKQDLTDITEQLKNLNSRVEARKEEEKKLKRARGDDLEAEILGEGPARDSSGEPASKRTKDTLVDRRGKVLIVKGIAPEHEDDLIVHMETFGELYDMHFNSKGTERSGTFTYSNADHAQKAFKEAASSFALADDLVVEWAAVALGSDEAGAVIPDEERKPEERVTAAGLLASIDDGENESDGSDS